jgi:hypothetical protein
MKSVIKMVFVDLLGCNAVWTCRYTNFSEKYTVFIFSALKTETVCFSETLVSIYKSTRRCNLEDQHWHLHRRENLKSIIKICNTILKSNICACEMVPCHHCMARPQVAD